MEKYNEEKEEKVHKIGGRCGVIFTSEVKSGQIRQAYLQEVCIESERHASILFRIDNSSRLYPFALAWKPIA